MQIKTALKKILFIGSLTLSTQALSELNLPSFASGGNFESDFDSLIQNVLNAMQIVGGGVIIIALVWAGIIRLFADDKGEESNAKIKNIIVGGAIIGLPIAIIGFIFG